MPQLFEPDFLYHYITANEIETLKQKGFIEPPISNSIEIPFPCFWLTTNEMLYNSDTITFLFRYKDFQSQKNTQGRLLNIARIKIKYSTSLIRFDFYKPLLHGIERSYHTHWGPRMEDGRNKRVYYYASILPIYNYQWLSFQYFDGKKWKEVDGWMSEQNLLSLSDTIHS